MPTPSPLPAPSLHGPSLAGRVALVTGGNRGLGLLVVEGLAVRGATVLLGARDRVRGEEALAGLRERGLGGIELLELDTADRGSIARAAAELEARHGRLDVLVNNAGILAYDDVLAPDPEAVERFFRTNTLGPWLLAAAAVPLMRRNGWGRIVNASTEMACFERMTTSAPTYRVSKVGLNAWTRSLALALEGSGILVNAVSPGWVRTEMGGPEAPGTPEQGAASLLWGVDLPDDGPTGGYFQNGAPLPR